MNPRHKVHWINPGHWPIEVGFCPSAKAYDRFIRKMESDPAKRRPFHDLGTAASAHFMDVDNPPRGMSPHMALVTLNANRAQRPSVESVAALLAHEATHIKQWMHSITGEHAPVDESGPGAESEAYFIQSVTQGLLLHYRDVIGYPGKRRKRKR